MCMKRRSVFISLAFAALLVSSASAAGRGTLQFTLRRPMVVSGTSVGPGDYLITWKTHSPETDVTFALHGRTVIEAHGKMVERPEKASQDTLVTARDESGNDVLKEIRFGGRKWVLLLD